MIPSGTTKIVLGGHLTGGEIFETGFWLTGTGITSNTEANDVAAAVAAYADASGSIAETFGQLLLASSGTDYVKAYHYTGGATAAFIGMADWVHAGGGNLPLLDQACVVVSLRTGMAGRQNRGRMYLPANGFGTANNVQYGNANIDQVAAQAAFFLSSLNGVTTPTWVPVVVSQTGSHTTPITSVVVDTKPDIQRRRANALVPVHVATGVVS